MDKFTRSGLFYSGFGVLGFGYEVFFVQPSRPFLLIMYGIVIGIGALCIFVFKEENRDDSD